MSQLSSWTTGVHREVLPNGLTLLVQRDDSAPVAAVVTHVKAGFFDEPDRWAGISHVFEHMFFKGTPTRGVGEIAKETKAAGGYLNASTTYDHTTYYTVLPARQLAEALAIQSDALMHATVDPGELSRELQVIIQEAKRKLDTPGAVAQETLHEIMYDQHRIRRWRIGYEEQLAGFTRADVYGYYQARYVPSRTIIVIVGDVDVAETAALARNTYGAWTDRPAGVDRSPEEPPRREVRVRTLRGDVTQAELCLGWRGVPPLHPDAIALDVAAGILSSGRGSWLSQRLREPGIATAVSAWHYAPTELGLFAVNVECDADKVTEAIAGVAEMTARLVLEGPSPDDLERARTLLLTRWARSMEEMDGRATSLASAEALGDYHLVDEEFTQLQQVTAEQVRDAARRILDPESVSAVVYLPRDAGVDLTVERVASAFAVTQVHPKSGRAAEPPNRRAALPRPSSLGSPKGDPERGSPLGPISHTAGVYHLALPAFDLLVRRKVGVPSVSMGLYLPRPVFDPPEQAGIAALALKSAVRGAAGRDAASLAFAFERLGGSVSSTTLLDWLGYSTTVLRGNLAQAAHLFDQLLFAPTHTDEAIAAEREILVAETRNVADDMYRYPFQLALAAGYGGRNYGLAASGLPETLAALSPEQVRAWHARHLRSQRGVVLAVGDIDPDTALDELAAVFGQHGARDAAPMLAPIPWGASGDPVVKAVERQKAQTAFALLFPAPSRRSEARHAIDVWSAVASGLGGRLFEALREKRSLAYTVIATGWQKARGGALMGYIATSPEREDGARREMLLELQRFAEELVSAEELRRATNYLAGQTEVGRQSASNIMGEMLDAWLAGGGLSDMDDPAERYRAVTAEDVRSVAASVLSGTRAEGIIRGSGGGR
jgi:zinc protease